MEKIEQEKQSINMWTKINSIKDISDTLYEILKNDKDLQRIVLKAREILGNNTLANFSGVFAREYVRVRNEVIKRQGNLPEDMKSYDNIRKLEVELEHRYNKYLSELSETKEIRDNKGEKDMEKLEFKTYDEFAEDKTIEIIENLDDEEKLDIYNRYCEDNEYYEDIIYENDEYFLKEMFGDDIQKAILSVECGNYKSTDRYVKLDAYGNLQSYYNSKEALEKNALDSELIDFTIQDKKIDLDELYNDYIHECLEAAEESMSPKEFKDALEEYTTDEMMGKYPEVYEIVNEEYSLSEKAKAKQIDDDWER